MSVHYQDTDNFVPWTISWYTVLDLLMDTGAQSAPRGELTYELPHLTVSVNPRRCVLNCAARKLSETFMAAEALWILGGDDQVSTIAPYNKHLAQFSDDGERFFGAYGPPLVAQLPYIVNTLRRDPMSRQATLTLWRPSPPPTKDVPCTVAMSFMIRDSSLQTHVYMRSSDAWLGLPYDIFNFSMIAHAVAAKLNEKRFKGVELVEPIALYLTAASSHLYERNVAQALACLGNQARAFDEGLNWTPPILHQDHADLITWLKVMRDEPACRWWRDQI